MLSSRKYLWPLALLVLGMLVLASCSEDDDPTAVATGGTIVVEEPVPSGEVATRWTVEGPHDFRRSGMHGQTFTNMPAGDYTIIWLAYDGWRGPLEETQNLPGSGTITFRGTFIELSTVVIDPLPRGTDAPWSLTGPDGYSEIGSGETTLTLLEAGVYTLTWEDMPDRITPISPEDTVGEGGTIEFQRSYYRLRDLAAGSFQMGSPDNELGRDLDEVQHAVTLTRGFMIGETEVTEQLWHQVTGEGFPDPQLPRLAISWEDAVAFCNELSTQEGLTPVYTIGGGDVTWNRNADGYRLPTEAEWEYACRAGRTTAFSNGIITDVDCRDPGLNAIGWYCDSSGIVEVVRQLEANDWNLYDMHGLMWEMVWDRYRTDYEALPATDPAQDVTTDGHIVIRGGGFDSIAAECRSASRDQVLSNDDQIDYAGFRIVRTVF